MITHTVSELAEICGATLEGDGQARIVGPASLAEAGPEQASFLGNPRYAAELETTQAGAVIVPASLKFERDGLALLRSENPNRAFSRLIETFQPQRFRAPLGVHPDAIVDPTAEVGPRASLGPRSVVGPAARIGAGVVLHPGAVVGPGAAVGAGSVLHPGVVLYAGVSVGERCILHAGCVIGSDGFGFDPTPEGWEKVPQCGTVVIEDEVEIGANCTIDRGRFGPTRIGRGAKLDNLVHVAHNVEVGEATLLVAQVGIAGSARVGRRAILAGQVGVGGHTVIGDGARVGGQSGVTSDIAGGKDYFGTPILEKVESLRLFTLYKKLPEFVRRLKALERGAVTKEE